MSTSQSLSARINSLSTRAAAIKAEKFARFSNFRDFSNHYNFKALPFPDSDSTSPKSSHCFPPFPLLKLPPELRNLIYLWAWRMRRKGYRRAYGDIAITWSGFSKTHYDQFRQEKPVYCCREGYNLLFTCRQVYNEASYIAYGCLNPILVLQRKVIFSSPESPNVLCHFASPIRHIVSSHPNLMEFVKHIIIDIDTFLDCGGGRPSYLTSLIQFMGNATPKPIVETTRNVVRLLRQMKLLRTIEVRADVALRAEGQCLDVAAEFLALLGSPRPENRKPLKLTFYFWNSLIWDPCNTYTLSWHWWWRMQARATFEKLLSHSWTNKILERGYRLDDPYLQTYLLQGASFQFDQYIIPYPTRLNLTASRTGTGAEAETQAIAYEGTFYEGLANMATDPTVEFEYEW